MAKGYCRALQYRQEPEGKYTKSDRRIMDFVEDYTDEFLFMSIGQLAERLGMSELRCPGAPDIWDTGISRR